ncbi:MAG: tripartite tricarboxylate transporter permease [Pseudomonadota bacterium]
MELLDTALPALNEAFSLILQPQQILYLVLGVLLGLSVGVFPGLGGIAGLSLVLPFLFGMDPVAGLALMVGLVAVIPTSDTFASVLMGIPGSSASQATVLDGFPLARNGEAAKALAAAFVSSLFGGIFGALVLTFFILIARPLVLAFGTPELLMVTILGLSMVGTLAGRIPLKGIVAAGLGMIVGAIGAAPALGSARLSFEDWPYLYDGLRLVIVGLGIFAVPEIISLLRQDRAIARGATLGAGWADGIRAWWQNIFLSLRCSGIGVVVGVIPGLGGSVVDWIAYGHTVQTTRDKSKFGQGEIRGVIGPESSNNAKEGGGLVPTLLFGIPGSGSMAVFIGGMILLGYEAGPQMISNDLNITYTVVWSLALANVIGAGMCIGLSGPIARLTTIRFTLLAPFLFMLIAFAAFQSRQSLGDLVALVAIGLLGIFMRRFGWSRPAFLIGFVLSDQAEVYTYQAAQLASIRLRNGVDEMLGYLFSPVVLIILAITVFSVWIAARQAKAILPEGEGKTGGKRAPVIFAAFLTAFLALAFIDAMTVEVFNDKIFPAVVSGVGLLCALAILWQMRRAPENHALFTDGEIAGEDAAAPHGLWSTLAWFLGLLVLSAVFGFVVALALFFLGFLKLRAGADWKLTGILTAAGIGFIVTMAGLLNRDFPPGLLQDYVNLPWPLG